MNIQKGITTVEAQKLQHDHGFNVIQDQRKISWIKKFIEQISSFLIILLLIAAALSFVIGEVIDGSLIAIIILINAGFGMYQEFKAEKAVAALKHLTVSTIRVIRDGKEQEIRRANLFFRGVPLSAGKHVVEFRYEPRSFTVGLSLSLLSLAVVTVWSIFLFISRKKK